MYSLLLNLNVPSGILANTVSRPSAGSLCNVHVNGLCCAHLIHVCSHCISCDSVLAVKVSSCLNSLLYPLHYTSIWSSVHVDRSVIKGYRTSSTIYLCMHNQMQNLWVRDATVRAYTNKSLNKCDNSIYYIPASSLLEHHT